MNFWLKNLIAAAIGGAANAITVIIVDPVNFSLTENARKVATVAAVGALLSVAAYLKTSPVPESK